MYGFLIFIFVVVCLLLMGIILIQSSKTGGMGTAMGGAAVQAAFGGQGADKLLTKITIGLAAAFMLLSISINLVNTPDVTNAATGGSIISQKAKSDVGNLGAPLDLNSPANPADNPTGTQDSPSGSDIGGEKGSDTGGE
ncbi:MAG: preprotein translocase subunit SecG [FCB group bacterium]|nr:preprotein translocase subunit SecG [FCB group bacterium]